MKELRVDAVEALMPLIREGLDSGQSVRFSPSGVSMMPMLRQGIDSVVLSPVTGKLRKYDLPLYQRADGKYVLHRVVKVGKTYTCAGDNQFVYEQGVEQKQLLAVVTAFYRGDRLWPVDALAYRIYCRCWCASRPLRHLWRRGMGWLRRLLK